MMNTLETSYQPFKVIYVFISSVS